jgi:hypothetical protein
VVLFEARTPLPSDIAVTYDTDPVPLLPMSTAYVQVFQSAILEAKKYKASGGDALADVLDLLSTRTPSGPGAAAKEGTGREEVRPPVFVRRQMLCACPCVS